MLLSLALALLTLCGQIQAWHVLGFAFLLGTANAFDAPARQAFVLELVSKADLTNAIALNSGMFNAAAAVGPAIAGITYAAVGPGYCFLVNSASFVAVIVALALISVAGPAPAKRTQSPLADLRQGLTYVGQERRILTLLGLVGASTLFGVSLVTLFPAWAVEVLHGNATTNGLLLSARGAGAMLSALVLAALGRIRIKGRIIAVCSFVYPALLMSFAATRSQWSSLLVLFVSGLSALLVLNLANALVQTLVRDDLRGRVMGLYSLIFLGSIPLGGFLNGMLAERLGVPGAITASASALLLCAALAQVIEPRLRQLE
jgi:predicted MFS family arabinose efflux permease